jgi:hypothetical protein
LFPFRSKRGRERQVENVPALLSTTHPDHQALDVGKVSSQRLDLALNWHLSELWPSTSTAPTSSYEATNTRRKEGFSEFARHLWHLNGGGLSAWVVGDITFQLCGFSRKEATFA